MARFSPLSPDDPRTVAGYTLRARLGAGGMGQVYLSFTPGGRPIAIKVVRAEYATDDEFRRRFRHEIAAAQRVQGLYTAPVIDADPDAPVPWLATVYVPGPSLHQAVGEHGPLPLPTVFRLLAGIAEALTSVHAAGVIHRDLKPANVLLAEDGPRVIDFGIARATDATTLTRTGARIGTPAFMSPEQVRGVSATPATDVFAAGQLAVFAATGSPAFGEGPAEALLYRIANQPPFLSDCPPVLAGLAARCLAKDPEERPGLSEIIELARAENAGETMVIAGSSWLPPAVAAELPEYRTTAAPPPPSPVPTRRPVVAPPVPQYVPPAPPPVTPPPYPAPDTQAGPPAGGIPVAAVVALVAVVAAAVVVSAAVGAVVLRSEGSGQGALQAGQRTTVPAVTSAPETTPAGTTIDTGSPVPERSSPPPKATQPAFIGSLTYEESGYTIQVPSGWSRRNGDNGVYWDAPGGGGTYLQIDPQSWNSPGTARAQAEQADRHAVRNSARFPGYRLLSITDTTYQDGAATDWEFTFDDPGGGGRIHSRDRFFIAAGRPYAIYLRGSDSGWSGLQDELAQFYGTFRPS